ncbi:aminoglycoside phosphotransferase family protein [Paenibacillus sp. M1]|uniref:Aminoglycoside phosphotransferase family protein n=1 Tax=Paenibacillus haidiansis TaxID=1574488 RepID=A0ABU7VXS8_9BACL
MEPLFKRYIRDWSSWGNVYQSISAFRGLIEEIFAREGLTGYEDISHLTPGTNAVFKVGNYVIKIFAPPESGADTEADYEAEERALQRAIIQGINTPKIVSASSIRDKYLFKYFIMEYIDGRDAGDILPLCSFKQKREFVHQLKENLRKINVSPSEHANYTSFIKRGINNERWNAFSNTIQLQRAEILGSLEISPLVYVHGDITAENVRMGKEGQVYIIDFADSTVAPAEYEYPPIVFSLFNYDIGMVHEFIGDLDYDLFIEKLFHGLLMHAFGANFVKEIFVKYTLQDISELTNLLEIKELIYSGLQKAGLHVSSPPVDR